MMHHEKLSKNVRWPISISLLQMALAAILTLTPITHATVVFSDGDFNLADWQSTKYYWGNGGSVTLSQIASGGNPGKFLEVDLYLQNAGPDWSVVYGSHLRNGATYDPAIQGAIQAIDYTINYMNLQTIGVGMDFAMTLKQDGNTYHNFREQSGTVPGWKTEADFGLQASSFGLMIPISYSFIVDFSQNPDFSDSGSPIEFGLATWRAHTESDNPAIENVGFDNWSVTVHPVPEPAAFTLMALGGLLLKKRKNPPDS